MPNLTQAQLDLKVYTGGFSSGRPASPTYTIIKKVIADEESVMFEIAELFKDYMEATFSGNYATISTSVWVYWDILKTYDDTTTQTEDGYGLGLQGYGYFGGSVNPQLNTGKQMDNVNLYIPEGESITIPIFKGTGGVTNVKLYKDGSIFSNLNYLIIDVPAGDTAPEDLIEYVRDANDIDYAVITKEDSTTQTVYVNKICSPKYSPYKISFLNRYGVIQDLWFFNKRTDSLSISREKYTRNTISILNNLTPFYPTNKATDVTLDIKADKKMTLNTGFVNEEYTEVIQQLLLSENVWITESNNVYAIIPQTQELVYKTRLNDKLINFSVEFKYAYNEFNIVR